MEVAQRATNREQENVGGVEEEVEEEEGKEEEVVGLE